MAKTLPAAQPVDIPSPSQGGSYTANPDTGDLTRVEHTAERGAADPVAASVSVNPSTPAEE